MSRFGSFKSTNQQSDADDQWIQIDDAVALLEKLEQADNPDVDKHTNPDASPKERAASKLLTIIKKQNTPISSLQSIKKLLQVRSLSWDNVQELIKIIDQHEEKQRQESAAHLATFTKEPYAQPEKLSIVLPNQPYYAVVSDDLDHEAIFAVEINAVYATTTRPPVEASCGDLLIALHIASDHIADCYGLGVKLRFAWRFISHNQTIAIALLVRVSGLEDADSTKKAAAEVWHTIEGLLPLNRTLFTYSPVTDPERLDWFRQPTTVRSAVAITRQEHVFEYEGKSIYGVTPLGMGDSNRQALLAEMLRQPGVNLIDMQITPTRWQHDEREEVRNMLQINNANLFAQDINPIDTLLNHIDNNQYLLTVQHYKQTLPREKMFVVQMTVASSETMGITSLPVVAALNLFGTSHYDIRPASLDRDREHVQRHLSHLTGEAWARSNAPQGLERIINLWTPDETLAAITLPIPGAVGLPGLPVMQVKITPIPPHLPDEGVIVGDAYDPTLNRIVPIISGEKQRARHTYLVGRTGTGKTTVLENLALQDIHDGKGVGIIDPHGDLIDAILAQIPPHRAQDVVLFEPSSMNRPTGLNILDVEGDFEKNMVISEFMGLLYTIYDPGRTGIIGPRFEQAVRNAMHTAMAIEGSTLVDVMRILSNRDYARACLKFVKDPMVLAYYNDIIKNQSDFHLSEVLDYITSKFGRFTGDTTIRSIIGQSKTTINFEEIMEDGKILLVNLSKGHIGQENSRFLGLLLVPRILIAAFSRAKKTTTERKPFYLYIDEFQNFTTPMLSTMLSEGRKYGLSLTLANQFLSQLTDEIREAVYGNVGTIGAFQVGIKDAYLLKQELYPVFNEDDLVNFPAFHMAFKMPLGGVAGRPFMVKTRPSNSYKNVQLAAAIRNHALLSYGRDADVIAIELQHRFDEPPKPRDEMLAT